MKRFIECLRPTSKKQSAANESEPAPVGEGRYSDDCSFRGSWTEQADSSIFDTGRLIGEKSKNKNAVSQETPDPEGDSLSSAEENMGVDPYNTGRFDTTE